MSNSSDAYTPPRFLFTAHLETIFPALIRKVALRLPYHRERISTPDNDFLDLDWLKNDSKKAVIISHGLEGNSHRAYVKGMAKTFHGHGYNVVAWNYRGCSEEMNRQLRFYHSGATDDLDVVVNHVIENGYSEIFLIGFSLGGNITLKYLGEKSSHKEIKKAAVFSVPMDLQTSCEKISRPSNWIYANRFLKSLKKKIILKAEKMPDQLSITNINTIKTLKQFDDEYTAPLHGFKNAIDYYTKCSSRYFASNISIPTLIVNALNDPFLSTECFPVDLLKDHPIVKLEVLTRGGHVGFAQFTETGLYWSEQRALNFINHAND
jgi:predicted alpha/beta-fold hydrolase